MAKEKFCGVYRKASAKFKAGQGTQPGVVESPKGWVQAEAETLTNAAAGLAKGRVGGTDEKAKVVDKK